MSSSSPVLAVVSLRIDSSSFAPLISQARVWFDNVQLPKDALLNRFANIRDDQYVQVGDERMRIEVIGQRLMTGRQAIAEAAILCGELPLLPRPDCALCPAPAQGPAPVLPSGKPPAEPPVLASVQHHSRHNSCPARCPPEPFHFSPAHASPHVSCRSARPPHEDRRVRAHQGV